MNREEENRIKTIPVIIRVFILSILLSFIMYSINYAQEITFKKWGVYHSGLRPIAANTGDLNNDLYDDIAVANIESNNISIFINKGTRAFNPAMYINNDKQICGIAIGELNNDTNRDIAITTVGLEEGNSVMIYQGNGDGTFLEPLSYEAGTYPRDLVLADFSKDDMTDIAVANYLEYAGVTIMENRGNMEFETIQHIHVGNCTIDVESADMNNDGIIDIISADCGDIVSILLGKGDGYFNEPIYYFLGALVSSFDLGYINNDKYIDLAIPMWDISKIGIMLNDGYGGIEVIKEYISFYAPIDVILRDFNGDGKMDYASANLTNSVSVRSGNGDGSFNEPKYYETGERPQDIESGDFNRDGYPDLVITNVDGNTITILKNKTGVDDDDNDNDDDNDDNNDNNNNDNDNDDNDDNNDDDTNTEVSPTPDMNRDDDEEDDDETGKCCG